MPPLNMLFLMSCRVMVLPLPRFSPVSTPTAAREMERKSMPLWVQNRESSMATKALIRSWGVHRKWLLPGWSLRLPGCRLSSGAVIYGGGIADGDDAVHIQVRGIVDDAHDNADADTGYDQNAKQTEHAAGLLER